MAQKCENADLIGVLVSFRCHIEASQPGVQPRRGCARWEAFGRSPHSRLRRQYGVMQVVTAHAVNIAGYRFITLI